MHYLQEVLYFFSFQDFSLNIVLLTTLFLGIASGLVGVITVLNHKTLIVNAISHSILPGVCFGFILSGTKNPWYLISGGFLSGMLSVLLINFLQQNSKVKPDAAIAVVLSFMFSIGILFLNVIQKSGNIQQTGLTDFLFGKASSLMKIDVFLFMLILFVVLTLVLSFYSKLKIYLFDRVYAQTIGISGFFINSVISTVLILVTSVGIQTVGVVLMSALLVAPASSALMWQNKFNNVLILSVLFSVIAGVIGVLISYIFPSIPTGPSIIICLSFIAYCSFLFSRKGYLYKKRRTKKNRNKILEENLLKSIYIFQIEDSENKGLLKIEKIIQQRKFASKDLNKGLKILVKNKYLYKELRDSIVLTNKGIEKGKEILKKHVLWEMYLQEYMNLKPTDIHKSAESIEHILTPELTLQLEILFENKKQKDCLL